MKALWQYILLCSSFFILFNSYGQFSDNFSDGNFTANPVWLGDVGDFEVDASSELHLNAPAVTAMSSLYTNQSLTGNVSWEFVCRMEFNSSSSNTAFIYLMSDQNNFDGSLNGYYVQLGNTQDEISLYKQTGTNKTKIIDGLDGRLSASTNTVRVKVTRSISGAWMLFVDDTGGTSYVNEGATIENSHTSSIYFGVKCQYTSTRSTKFYFDDFLVQSVTVIDASPPIVSNVSVLSSNSLQVTFNEPVTNSTATSVLNYLVNNGLGSPVHAVMNSSSTVTLYFVQNFTNGSSYELEVQNISDINGNISTLTKHPFNYVDYLDLKKEVVFNEIFADPSPSVLLPTEEYIELYNTTASPIDVTNWEFVNTTTSKTIPAFVIGVGEHLIVCDQNDVSLFTGYGNVIGVSSFSALSNGGDSLTLIDDLGVIQDIVVYTDDWYQDVSKDNGGWSLELINPKKPCSYMENWIASNDIKGGTPGSLNSVYSSLITITNLLIDGIEVNTDKSIIITLNTPIKKSLQLSDVFVDNGINVAAISFPEVGKIEVIFQNALQPGVVYEVKLANVESCDQTASNSIEGVFGLPEVIEKGDLLINEVLFDPFPGGNDYVEIYNNSDKFIDLSKVLLANSLANFSSTKKVICATAQIMAPKAYRLLTEETSKVISFYPNSVEKNFIEVASLPSFSNEDGNVVLVNAGDTILDVFSYNQNMHFPLLTDEEGVSLERIDFDSPTEDLANWQSAASSENYGTPGAINSQNYRDTLLDVLTVYPETFSPDGDGFDEELLITLANFTAGWVGSITIYNTRGELVKEVIQNELLANRQNYTWDGESELVMSIPQGIYIVLLDAFDLEGNSKKYKVPFVLAKKTN